MKCELQLESAYKVLLVGSYALGTYDNSKVPRPTTE